MIQPEENAIVITPNVRSVDAAELLELTYVMSADVAAGFQSKSMLTLERLYEARAGDDFDLAVVSWLAE